MPDPLWENRFTRYCVELEWSDSSTLPSVLPWLDIQLGKEAVIEAGLRWIVLHPSLYHPPQYARMVRFLDLVATPVHSWEATNDRATLDYVHATSQVVYESYGARVMLWQQ